MIAAPLNLAPRPRVSPPRTYRGSTPLVALVAAHLLDHLGQTPATPPTLRRGCQPGKGTRGQTSSACGHESFEAARRDRNQLGDRSAAIRDGHDFTFSGVRDNGRSVLLQCTYANRFHVLHCSTIASHAIWGPRKNEFLLWGVVLMPRPASARRGEGADGLHRQDAAPAQLPPWTFWSFAREFSPFTARDGDWAATLIPDTVLPSIRPTAAVRSVRPSPPEARARRAPWSKGPSATGGHAAASSDGHVSHDADRFASPRARRAAVARDLRSAAPAAPVPTYISSGVCPRNAECGSTRFCSST